MALDAFLMFKDRGKAGADIKGETKDKQMLDKYKDTPPFDLANWSFSVSQEVNVGSASGGMGAGKVTFDQFNVTKNIDKSSPYFFLTCCNGGHYKDVSLMIRKAGANEQTSGEIYLRFDFKMVFVSNIKWSHADPSPTEEITFDYGALQVSYSAQQPDGGLEAAITQAWSRVLNNNEFTVTGGT
jgi:type VI secretion system secreted protein Hcp